MKDDLDPARGLALGVVLSLLLWWVIIAVALP